MSGSLVGMASSHHDTTGTRDHSDDTAEAITREWRSSTGQRFDVEVVWVEVDGRMEPLAVTIRSVRSRDSGHEGGAEVPLSSALLREIPFGTIFKEQRSTGFRFALARSLKAREQSDAQTEARAQRQQKAFKAVGKRTPEGLAAIAAAYRDAHLYGSNPVATVASKFNIPRSTAAKRVMAARRAGLLPPALPGKANA